MRNCVFQFCLNFTAVADSIGIPMTDDMAVREIAEQATFRVRTLLQTGLANSFPLYRDVFLYQLASARRCLCFFLLALLEATPKTRWRATCWATSQLRSLILITNTVLWFGKVLLFLDPVHLQKYEARLDRTDFIDLPRVIAICK